MTTQLETAPTVKARRKPQRFASVVHRERAGIVLQLTIRTAPTAREFLYIVSPIRADFGRGFEVEKEDGTVYHVNLDGERSTCDCRGHINHGHCKHVSSLAALDDAGLLPALLPGVA